MTDLYLDPVTWDLKLEQDDAVIVSDRRDVAQEIAIRLRMWKREFFADVEEGLIDRDVWFEGSPNLSRIRDDIRRECLKVNGVISISSPVLEPDEVNRVLNVTIDGESNDGPFTVTVPL
jgi:hypothetical protein